MFCCLLLRTEQNEDAKRAGRQSGRSWRLGAGRPPKPPSMQSTPPPSPRRSQGIIWNLEARMVMAACSNALFRPSPVYITVSSVVGFGGERTLLGVQLFVNYRAAGVRVPSGRTTRTDQGAGPGHFARAFCASRSFPIAQYWGIVLHTSQLRELKGLKRHIPSLVGRPWCRSASCPGPCL